MKPELPLSLLNVSSEELFAAWTGPSPMPMCPLRQRAARQCMALMARGLAPAYLVVGRREAEALDWTPSMGDTFEAAGLDLDVVIDTGLASYFTVLADFPAPTAGAPKADASRHQALCATATVFLQQQALA